VCQPALLNDIFVPLRALLLAHGDPPALEKIRGDSDHSTFEGTRTSEAEDEMALVRHYLESQRQQQLQATGSPPHDEPAHIHEFAELLQITKLAMQLVKVCRTLLLNVPYFPTNIRCACLSLGSAASGSG
jgi:hypothetical protein